MVHIPKDYWMQCDRTGMNFRRSEMREEWTGLWVHKSVLNFRHPQDFVESVPDDPSVPVSRPDVVQSVGETTLNGALTVFATSATLTAISGVEDEHPVGIVLDNDTVHWTFVDGDPVGNAITLNTPIPAAAADGNTVYLPSINNETWT